MIVLSVILCIIGLAILVVGVLALTNKLPGNSVVGLRIPEVRQSQENWTLAHRIAGPGWIGSGLVMLLGALVSSSASGWMWLVVAMLVVGSLVLAGIGSAMAAHALAQIDATRQREEQANSSCCSAGAAGEGGTGAADGNAAASAGGCCGSADGEPTAEQCASGQACGSCSLNGACEGGGAAFDARSTSAQRTSPAVDVDAARRAVEAQDQR